jgi:hypothetical protein
MTVENKGKLILTEIFPSVQKHDIFIIDAIQYYFISLFYQNIIIYKRRINNWKIE